MPVDGDGGASAGVAGAEATLGADDVDGAPDDVVAATLGADALLGVVEAGVERDGAGDRAGADEAGGAGLLAGVAAAAGCEAADVVGVVAVVAVGDGEAVGFAAVAVGPVDATVAERAGADVVLLEGAVATAGRGAAVEALVVVAAVFRAPPPDTELSFCWVATDSGR